MSKKFTSCCALVAAALLSIPAHAQVQGKVLSGTADRPVAELRALDRKVSHSDAASRKLWLDRKAREEAAAAASAGHTAQPALATDGQLQGGLTAGTLHANPYGRQITKHEAADAAAPARSSAATSGSGEEVVNGYGIITAPAEGEHTFYTRSGMAYLLANGRDVATDAQGGLVEVVETADHTIYIRDIISHYQRDTWVKGVKEGNTITLAAGQPVSTSSGTKMCLHRGLYKPAANDGEKTDGDIVFTVEGNTIALADTDAEHFIGIFWADDGSWNGFGDYGTVWTLFEGYEPPSTEPVELPEGATVEDWYADGINYYDNTYHATPQRVKVAFVDDEVYLSGIFALMPTSWIRGTVEDGTVTFPAFQYLGQTAGPTDLWLYVTDQEAATLAAATFAYDAAVRTLTLDASQRLYANGATDRIYRLESVESLTLSPEAPEAPEPVVLPAGATAESWYAEGITTAGAMPERVQVAFVGDEVYLSGIFASFPASWIRGTRAGSRVTFPTLQYLGDSGDLHVWSYAARMADGAYEALDAVTFTYDAGARILTLDAGQVLAANGARDRLLYLEYISELRLGAAPLPPPGAPYTADFRSAPTFEKCTVIDRNGDGCSWHWVTSGARYRYHYLNKADDYLVLPVTLEAGKNYTVLVSAANEGFPEKFEVKAGKAPTAEALDITAIAETTVTSEEFADFEGNFTADETGTWYVAIHATSDPDNFYLHVRSLSILVAAEGSTPAAATAFTATAGEQGAPEVNIAFTAPTVAIDGSALVGTMDIDVCRDDAVVHTFRSVAAGTALTWQDTDVADATAYTYYVQATTAAGPGAKTELLTVWVGHDLPADVENVQVAALGDGTISLTWDPIAGVHGGYVDPAAVRYSVTTIEFDDFFGIPIPTEGETLGSVTGQTAATVAYPVDEGEPRYGYFGVKATVGDSESKPTSWFAYALIGTPYELPLVEAFTDQYMHYLWDYTENAVLSVSPDGSGDDVALALLGYDAGEAAIESFKLDVRTAPNATLLFDAKQGTAATDRLTVYGILPDGTTADLGTMTLTRAYQTFSIRLPESLKGDRWVRLGIRADIDAPGAYVLLDNLKVLDFYPHDLAVAVEAPASVEAGCTATLTATVSNVGEQAASGYAVVITVGDKELLNTTFDGALAPFATATVSAELATSIFDPAAELAVTATVRYEADEAPANNTAQATVAVVEPMVPSVTDVAADIAEGELRIMWTAPEMTIEEVTEDFEQGADGWTFIDSDGDGFNWTHHLNTNVTATDIAARSGRGSVYSTSYDNDSRSPLFPDNWLVTPLAKLDGTFRFWATGQDPNFPAEHFQVWASADDAEDISTFVPVSAEYVATGSWVEYTADLSAFAGADGWVAIRHFNVSDEYMLIVDDVTYLAGTPGIAGYNVYVDGQLAAGIAADRTVATVTVPGGVHEVAVSVVYVTGQESRPVGTTIDVPAGIDAVTVMTKAADVYSVDGRMVRRQATSLQGLAPGMYVIGGKKAGVR